MDNQKSSHGWKTYLAAAAAIAAGGVALANGDVLHGIQGIVSGIALIGLRGAAAKIVEAVRELIAVSKEG
jgi:hypothetical protein